MTIIKNQIKNQFKLKDLEKLNYLLNFEVLIKELISKEICSKGY